MKTLLFFILLVFARTATAEWGMELSQGKNLKSLRIGTRLQGIAEYAKNDSGTEFWEFYARRVRLQVQTKFYNNWKVYFDLRNDNSNKYQRGEGSFQIGDGYIQIPISEIFSLKLFRSKVDVSYSQTVSSSNLVYLERASISDYAANFISESRRATNAQINGYFSNLTYQAVLGAGIHQGDFEDGFGNNPQSIVSQNPMFGGKLRWYPLGYENKKLTETSFNGETLFSLGAGAFFLNNIDYQITGTQPEKLDRRLTNIELVAKWKSFVLVGEYFDFDGEIASFATGLEGSSDGFYILLNYHFNKSAVFARFENWNKFSLDPDHEYQQTLVGYNYHLKENKIRFGIGLLYEKEIINMALTEDKKIQTNIMMHY